MTTDQSFDLAVIGSGVGGVAAAARLTQHGYRVLLTESRDRIGGRASSREVDGFILNDGALAIERDGPIADLYQNLGLHLDLHVPRPETVVLWGTKAFNASTGLAGWLRAAAPTLLNVLSRRISRLRPRPGQSTADWLNTITRNRTVHGLVDNVCGAFFAATGADLPADVFLSYLSEGSAFKNLGFAPGGTIEVWKPLAAYVEQHGGEVWLDAPATGIDIDIDGTATGVRIDRAGVTTTVRAGAVISNIGPINTVELIDPAALPAGYPESVAAATNGGAILTVHFASPVPLADWHGTALAARSRRITYLVNFSAPEQRQITRAGWHLYCAAATPHPATGPFDLEAEKALALDDIRDHLPGFDQHAEILAWDITAHDNPAQRAISGYDLPVETPVPNLWNVGDGVKPWGDAGTAACVRSADAVIKQLTARWPARTDTSSAQA